MTRGNASARAAGQRFERLIADYLRDKLDDRIDIRPKNGRFDRGDIGGLRTVHGGRIVAELKDHNRLELAEWLKEAEQERGNDDADVALTVHKRRGKSDPGQQYVTMTLASLVILLGGDA